MTIFVRYPLRLNRRGAASVGIAHVAVPYFLVLFIPTALGIPDLLRQYGLPPEAPDQNDHPFSDVIYAPPDWMISDSLLITPSTPSKTKNDSIASPRKTNSNSSNNNSKIRDGKDHRSEAVSGGASIGEEIGSFKSYLDGTPSSAEAGRNLTELGIGRPDIAQTDDTFHQQNESLFPELLPTIENLLVPLGGSQPRATQSIPMSATKNNDKSLIQPSPILLQASAESRIYYDSKISSHNRAQSSFGQFPEPVGMVGKDYRRRSMPKSQTSFLLQRPPRDVNWHDLIERLIDVRCASDHLIIRLHYEQSYSNLDMSNVARLQSARVLVGQNPATMGHELTPERCKSHESLTMDGSLEGALRVDVGLQDCNMSNGTDGTVLVYSNQITVVMTKEDSVQKYLYAISCAYPNRRSDMAEMPIMKLNWFLMDDKSPYIYFQGAAELSWYKSSELQAFPINCSLSDSKSTPSEYNPSSTFLIRGCPRQARLSTVRYNRYYPIRVSVDPGLLPLKANYSYAHCLLMPCMRTTTKSVYGIPMCPLSTHCNVRAGNIPWDFDKHTRIYASAGPLLPDASKASTCAESCRSPAGSPGNVHAVQHGVSTHTVALVAFTCFLLGAISTAGIWVFHSRILQRLKDRRQNNASQSGDARMMLPPLNVET